MKLVTAGKPRIRLFLRHWQGRGELGAGMNVIANLCRVTAIVAACSLSPLAWAAAPVGLQTEIPMMESAVATPAKIYELDTEMVVHNWVICVSQGVAEQLVQAREVSAEKAVSAYESLKDERKCGQFAELRVILQKPVYASAAESGFDARVFDALVNLADNWASAFVVTGGLPEE
jgi:hypothetical protein